MPGQDFFSTFNPAGAVKDVTALAMRKYELDQAAAQFNQQMGMRKTALDMEARKFQMEKDAITKKNLLEQAVKAKVAGLMQPTPAFEPSAVDLETGAIPAPQMRTPAPTAEDLARAMVEADPSESNLQSLVKAREADVTARRLGQQARDTAAYRQARLAAEQAKADKEKSELAQINQKDYTPESFAAYTQSGNRADLVPYRTPGADAKEAEQWSDPYTINVAGKPVTVRKNLKTNKVEKIAEDVSTTVRVQQTGQMTDKDILMPQIRTLPKLKREAQDSARRVRLYQDLSAMADKGAGGLVPGLKGILSPVLESLGMDATIESEAQAYQLMARAGVGSMRLMLVGSGQVSNYEQGLMQRLSGGSIETSREAAKLLFKYYAKESQRVVEDYNQTVTDVSEVEPNIGKVYKKIELGNLPVAQASAGARNAKGWKLHTDAKGNKAYVSPDGKQFEEVK